MKIPFDTCDIVIFDLGNVLIRYSANYCLDRYDFTPEIRQRIADAVFRSVAWQEGDRGTYGPDTWCEAFISNDPEIASEIRRVYTGLAECIQPTAYTPDLIRWFRDRGYRIYYLSNYSEGLYEMTKDRLSFIETFDGGVFSWQEKCIKPDPQIYRILLDRYQIDPARALFFDDIEENAAAACREGIHGIVFTPSVALDLLNN